MASIVQIQFESALAQNDRFEIGQSLDRVVALVDCL